MEELKMDQLKKIAKQLGSHGGSKTFKLYGSDHYRDLQKKGTEAKKRKKLI